MSNQAFRSTSISSLPCEVVLMVSSHLSLPDFLNLRNSASFYSHLLAKELSKFGGRMLSRNLYREDGSIWSVSFIEEDNSTIYKTRLFQNLICTGYDGSPEKVLLTSADFGFWGTAEHLFKLGTRLDKESTIKGGLYLLEAIHLRKARGIPNLLVSVGVDLTQKLGECGSTALHLACCYNDCNLINKLINHGADIESKDNAGRTPLFRARNSPRAAEILLHHGANVNAQNGMGSTCLHYASKDVTEHLLECGADTEIKNNQGNTPLHETLTCDKVLLLLNHNADVNSRNKFGCTPLFYTKTADITQLLIENKADVNCIDNDLDTAFHEAADVEILKLLLKHRKDSTAFDRKGNFGLTPFNAACLYSSREFQQVFLECGVDINTTDIAGNTPLHYTKDNSIVQHLIANGANIDSKNKQGSTPLNKAVTDSLIEKAQILLVRERV